MSDTITHEPDCTGWDNDEALAHGVCRAWCYGCARCEPCRDGDYLVCGECLHVYRTAQALELAYLDNRPNPEDDPLGIIGFDHVPSDEQKEAELFPLSAHEIPFCPVCLHDF